MPTIRLIPGLIACAIAASILIPSAAMPAPGPASPGEMAAIEATAPLDDPSPSDEAVKAAIAAAVQRAARGAIAMGLPWLRVQAAYVRPGYVGVQVLAMASPSDDDLDDRASDSESTAPDPGADRDADDSTHLNL